MKSSLEALKKHFTKVNINAIWSGTSAQAAKDNFDRLSANFPDFVNAVIEFSDYLNNLVANYHVLGKEVMSENN